MYGPLFGAVREIRDSRTGGGLTLCQTQALENLADQMPKQHRVHVLRAEANGIALCYCQTQARAAAPYMIKMD